MSAGTLARQAATTGHGRPRRVWVSYARLSKARNEGKGTSLQIGRQHRENRAYIDRVDPGARVIEMQDDGVSGFLDKMRPGFNAALDLVANRQVDAFIAWHADRISRNVEVTARVVNACQAAGVELHTALGGWHADPTRLYIESVLAEAESRQKRERQLSKHRELADTGGFTGGQRRFGYEPTNPPTVRESEAAIIRDMAGRLLLGESLASLARWLNDAGIATARGSEAWGPSQVRSLLLNPRLIGVRLFNGERLASAFPRIMDDALFLAVGDYLGNPMRRTTDSRAGKGKHLLTGIAVCDLCSAPVAGLARKDGRFLYRCTGCGGFERRGADIDAMVTEYVIARLEEMPDGVFASHDANAQSAALTDEQAALTAQRDALAGLLAAGDLDAPGYAAAVAAITKREAEIANDLAALAESAAAPIRALEGATGPVAASAWAKWGEDTTGAGLARRRAVVALLVDVRIGKAGKGHKGRFNPDTVRIEYRDLA